MGVSTDRTVYVGTNEGLFTVELNGTASEPSPLGLQGRGGIRYPVAQDRTDPAVLYVGTNRGGMFRSRDRGRTWQEIDEGITYKEIWSIVQHPTTGVLYAGTGPTSVFKSVDGGDTWEDCEQLKRLPESKEWTFPDPPHVSHVKGLAMDEQNPDLVLGAIEEGWLIRSKDAGKTWETLKDGTEFDAHSVVVMPDDSSIVMSTSGKGVFRSTNGGDSFTPANNGLDRRYLAQLAVHPSRPQVLFTAGAEVPPPFWRRPEGANGAVYRSEDQGGSWRRLTGGLPDHIHPAPRSVAADPTNADTVLVGFMDGSAWMTQNGGESFAQVVGGLPPITSLRVVPR